GVGRVAAEDRRAAAAAEHPFLARRALEGGQQVLAGREGEVRPLHRHVGGECAPLRPPAIGAVTELHPAERPRHHEADATAKATAGGGHRGSLVSPIRYSSMAAAHWRPSRMAQTTSDWPRR